VQADSIVSSPGNPQSLNRYSYCLGNPLVYVDPSGHWFKPPPTLGPRQEFEVIDWPVALKLTTMAMCVAAPNCYIETQGHKGYSESDIDSGSFGTMYVPYTTTSVKTIWNDPEQWADYLIKSSLPVAEWAIAPELGALRPAARGLAAAEEGILLTEAQGLQTRTAGLFDDVILGTHGDDATRYLWTIDNRGVNLAFEHTTFPTPRGYLVHSNLSSEAYFAGEAWFVGPNEVVINAGSGRWGDRSGVTQAMWDAAIRIWEGLGYIVRTLPLGER
jgi:hypothetical protein